MGRHDNTTGRAIYVEANYHMGAVFGNRRVTGKVNHYE